MSAGDDETLKAFIEESLEHLANIETDLLEIEKAGSSLDNEKVNKVFRAAHSIKGGAGFIGLNNIKTLSHHMENVLGLIRNGKLIPNPENINFLLLASDTLKDLLMNVEKSDQMDIRGHIEALSAIMDQSGPPTRETVQTPSLKETSISFPDGVPQLPELAPDPEQIKEMKEEGKSVYLLEIPMDDDRWKEPGAVERFLKESQSFGTLLDHRLDRNGPLPTLKVLFACVLDPGETASLLEVDRCYVHEIVEDGRVLTPDTPHQTDITIQKSNPSETNMETHLKQPSSDGPAVSISTPQSAQPVEGLNRPEPGHDTEFTDRSDFSPETTLRVHVGLLDSLMTLAGELVLGRNQLLQSLSKRDLDGSEAVGKRIDRITSELQEAVMRTRMQPIGNVFNRFPRLARDLSRKVGKEVALSIEGKNVELDKTLIEAIGDPLTHLVRNAIDHGIETPDHRERAGKHPIGQIHLKAFHEAGQVNIEIRDDGRGLDGRKLTEEAVEMGFITRKQAAKLSFDEQIQLVFLPGFSLAKEVTDLSGRGVGMDVVKTNLDRLGGQVDIATEPGESTTVRIKVPLTLAIIPSQIILTEGERYAIPQVNLVELIRVPARQVQERLEIVGEAEVVRLRSRLLPLVRLSDTLGIPRTFTDPDTEVAIGDRRMRIADRRSRKSSLFGSMDQQNGDHGENGTRGDDLSESIRRMRTGEDRRYRADSGLNIVVVSSGDMKYGLVVDALFDSEEIVVHPLGRHLKQTKGYVGATIMGDGRVALILDIVELAQLAELSPVHKSTRAKELAQAQIEALKNGKDKQSLLIFRNAEEERFAVPLNQVLRIERIRDTDVEMVSGKKVMQYRGGNLLLFTIDQVASVNPMDEKGPLLVLVFMLAGREIGLLAKGPVDAVSVSGKLDQKALKQPGIMGSTVINGHTTLLVDVFDIISTLNPDWFDKSSETEKTGMATCKILFAEDSDFFRNQVKGFMEDEGYSVIEAEDGLSAWHLLEEHGADISLVVTDLEMPNLDGFGLAERIKSDERYQHLPIIALTTLAEDDDLKKSQEVSIEDYQIKLDKEKLMESINRFMKGNPMA